ncbi:galactose-1-epimerase [Thaumasiovibrio sp. DFM-14]|uniref:galactose-1-epimerase n=1 Tax=Thaumasiovibrio sp. DFM-14 TaxID=3384792 RepID=UPI0039A1820A
METHLELLQQTMTSTPSFDGEPAKLIHLRNQHGMTVSFMDIGATWLSCTVPVNGVGREVLLCSPDMQAHMAQSAYLGSIVGRYANRIAKGQFTLGEQLYQLGINNGENSLHGGQNGFDKRRWRIETLSETEVMFVLSSPDGDEGYPGHLDVSVTYTLTADNALQIRYDGQCDKTCPVNLTNHAYFNLAGEGAKANALQHTLQMEATHYLPTDHHQIPTGELKEVVQSSFDFIQPKQIGAEFLADDDQRIAGGYDHAFVFSSNVTNGKSDAVTLTSPAGDLVMKIKTTKPAIQLYTGNFLMGVAGVSKEYQAYDGVALETQYFPDGPNHSEWVNNGGLLPAGERYQHQTTYQFIA